MFWICLETKIYYPNKNKGLCIFLVFLLYSLPNLLPTKVIPLLDSSKKLSSIITNWDKWETGNFCLFWYLFSIIDELSKLLCGVVGIRINLSTHGCLGTATMLCNARTALDLHRASGERVVRGLT